MYFEIDSLQNGQADEFLKDVFAHSMHIVCPHGTIMQSALFVKQIPHVPSFSPSGVWSIGCVVVSIGMRQSGQNSG